MRIRTQRLFLVLGGSAIAYAAFVACGGDDDTGTNATADAGNETSTVDTFVAVDTGGGTDGRSPELTGSSCMTASDCYSGIDAAALQGGGAVCIDKVSGGYCTHTCTKDEDCCAVPGECRTGLKQVCASFENQGDKYCFLSCEDTDIAAATDAGANDAGNVDGGGFDGTEYCHKNASTDFGCRSTGGGQSNRQVCLPEGTGDGGAGDGGGKKDGGDGGSDAADAADG